MIDQVSFDAVTWLLIFVGGMAGVTALVMAAVVIGAAVGEEIDLYFTRIGGSGERTRWREEDAADASIAGHSPLAAPETLAVSSGKCSDVTGPAPAAGAIHG